MAKLVTDELQDRLNEWCRKLGKTSIVAIQNEEERTFDVSINAGEELASGFSSIVTTLYVICPKEHRKEFSETVYGLVAEGIRKGREWVKEHEGK